MRNRRAWDMRAQGDGGVAVAVNLTASDGSVLPGSSAAVMAHSFSYTPGYGGDLAVSLSQPSKGSNSLAPRLAGDNGCAAMFLYSSPSGGSGRDQELVMDDGQVTVIRRGGPAFFSGDGVMYTVESLLTQRSVADMQWQGGGAFWMSSPTAGHASVPLTRAECVAWAVSDWGDFGAFGESSEVVDHLGGGNAFPPWLLQVPRPKLGHVRARRTQVLLQRCPQHIQPNIMHIRVSIMYFVDGL